MSDPVQVIEDAIRSRRTHKAYGGKPVSKSVLRELFELARWAPNHHLTNPWRFRVLGPGALAHLKEAADALDAGSGAKLDRAPTLVIVTSTRMGDPVQDEEDLLATGVAAYIVLLAAHARGLVGYWRTPGFMRTADGRVAAGIPEDERFVALLHLGHPRQEKDAPERAPAGHYVTYLP